MKTVAVFHNRGGVGKISLVYHLAWMYAELDCNVLVADLDPQANLTSMFLDDEALEDLWADERADGTIYASLQPLLEGTGDVTTPHVTEPAPGIGLVAGDMLLSGAEDELTSQWPACLDRRPRAFRVLSAISRALHGAAERIAADLILMDVGPNLGALNRAVLVTADHVVVPLAADLYSIRVLHDLGPTLRRWRGGVVGAPGSQPGGGPGRAARGHAADRVRRVATCGAAEPPGPGVRTLDGTHPGRVP